MARNGLPYYQRYPRDFIEGCVQAQLSFEARTTYSYILDLIYLLDGRLPDDPKYIAGQLGCSVRMWKRIRDELVESGKLIVTCSNDRPFLTNSRSLFELEKQMKFRRKQSENRAGRRKNNDLDETMVERWSHLTDSYKERRKVVANGEGSDLFQQESQNPTGSPPPPPSGNSRRDRPDDSSARADPPAVMVEIWNEMAARVGVPRVQKLTDVRRKHARARLRNDLGGEINQWRAVVARVAASSFLRGEGGRESWKGATFDWLVDSPNNLAKVMEGQYDDAPRRNGVAHGLPKTIGGDPIWYGDPAERPPGHREPSEAGVAWDWRRQQVRR